MKTKTKKTVVANKVPVKNYIVKFGNTYWVGGGEEFAYTDNIKFAKKVTKQSAIKTANYIQDILNENLIYCSLDIEIIKLK